MADEPWQRLAELVRLRREERRLSQRELGTAAGTTDRLISDIERAARTNYEPATLRAVSRALGWTPDSISTILAGGDPNGDQSSGEPTMMDRLHRLELDVAALKERIAGERDPDNDSTRTA
jgi:transcriptional regulator with XRE-family HTH domain